MMSDEFDAMMVVRDVVCKLQVANEQVRILLPERDQLKAELATLRESEDAAQHAAKRAVDELAKLQSKLAAIRGTPSSIACQMIELKAERDKLKSQVLATQAERDHFRALVEAHSGEPRDNGDGTVTALKPVTYPKGLDVECVRAPKIRDLYAGNISGSGIACYVKFGAYDVRLILRKSTKPPESVTWEARLPDGEVNTGPLGITCLGWVIPWNQALEVMGVCRPPKVGGRYEFSNGVGTLIEAAQ